MVTMSRDLLPLTRTLLELKPLVGTVINAHSEDHLLIIVCKEATEISVHDYSALILLLVRGLETTITQD